MLSKLEVVYGASQIRPVPVIEVPDPCELVDVWGLLMRAPD